MKETQAQSLADHVTAILSNPETPAELYNALVEQVIELSDETRVGVLHPEILKTVLPLIIKKKDEAYERPLTGERSDLHNCTLPRATIRELTREAVKGDGDTDSFVLLLLSVSAAIKANNLLAAENTLFESVTFAYQNSMRFVDSLMSYRDQMKKRLEELLQDHSG